MSRGAAQTANIIIIEIIILIQQSLSAQVSFKIGNHTFAFLFNERLLSLFL